MIYRYTRRLFFFFILLMFASSFVEVHAKNPDIACALQGLNPASQYATVTYTLGGGTCAAAANWTVTCGSIIVGSQTTTSIQIFFNSPSCFSSVIKALNSSGGTIASITVTINPAPALGGGTISNASQSVNYNTTPALLSTSSATNGSCESYAYQWYSSPNNVDFISIAATGQNYQPGALTSTTYFRRRVTCGPQSANSNVATVTVYPQVVSGTPGPSRQSINYNTTPSALSVSAGSGGNGSYSYQWQSSTSSNGTYTPTGGGTSPTYSPPALTATTYFNVVTNSNGAVVTSSYITVTVYPQVSGGSINPAAPSVNYNTSPGQLVLSGVSGGNGSYSYQWQSATASNFSDATNVGSNATTYTPPNLTANTYYRVVVTSNGATANSGVDLVNVYPQLQPGVIDQSKSNIAYNTDAGGLIDDLVSGGSGTYSYQWFNSPDGTTWSLIPSAHSANYNPGVLISTTYYQVTITSNGVSATAPYVVIYVLQAGSASPATSTINYNTSPGIITLSGVSGGHGGFSYQWQSSTDNFATLSNVGTNTTTFTPSNLTATTYYRVGVTSNGFTAFSSTSMITVYPALQTGSFSPLTQSINYNAFPSLIVLSGTSGGSGSYSYQWQSSPNSNGTYTPITGATGTTMSGDTPLTSSIYYQVVVTSNGVSATTNTASVIVYPQLIGGSITPATATINYNTSPGQLSLGGVSGGTGSYTYQWQNAPTSAFTNPVNVGTNTTYTPGNLTAGSFYRVGVSSNGVTVYSGAAQITVYPVVVPGTISPATQTINYNAAVTALSLSGTSGGNGNYSYQWQSSPDNSFGSPTNVGTNTTTYTPSRTTSAYYRVAVTSNGAVVNSTSAHITVYPAINPGEISPPGQSIVINNAPGRMMDDDVSGGIGSYTYQWNQSSNGTSWTPISGANNFAYSPGVLTSSTYYTMTAYSNGASATTAPALIAVFPSVVPGAVTPSGVTIDGGESPGLLTCTAATLGACSGNYVYEWQRSTDGISFTGTGITTLTYTPPIVNVRTWFRIKVTCGTEVKYTNTSEINALTIAAATGLNYLRTREIKISGVMDKSSADLQTDPSNVKETTQYFDGLGRPIQTLSRQASPLGKDMVLLQVYDDYNREVFHYLPYTSPSANGNYKAYPMAEQDNFNATQFPTEQFYFGKTDYEPSPLQRTLNTYAPGNSWVGSSRAVSAQYLLNDLSEAVQMWSIAPTQGSLPTSSGAYPSGQLTKNVTTDESTNKVIEYNDKDGHVILKKVQAVSSPGTTHSGWACTYYVYDDVGNLRFVMQPAAVQTIDGTWTISQALADGLCFRYEYDARNRMIVKKIPGAQEVWMVYDLRDRLVLTQDANQRAGATNAVKYWTFTKYDLLDRPIATGIKDTTTTIQLTQSQMQAVVDTYYSLILTTKPWRQYSEYFVGAGTANNVHGYTNKSYPQVTTGTVLDPYRYLTVTFYDNYTFRNDWAGVYTYKNESQSQIVNGVTYTQPTTENTNVRGQVTGSKTKTLDGGITGGYTWLKAINYYDDRYRVVQTLSDNYKSGADRVTNVYDFTGKVLKTKSTHTTNDITWTARSGVSLIGNRLTKILNSNGWNAGAASQEQLAAGQSGWVELIVSEATTTQRLIGLSSTNPDLGIGSIEYSFYLDLPYLRVYERANLKTYTGIVAGDIIRIERNGTTVTYKRNGSLVWTSTVPSTGILMVDASMYTYNAAPELSSTLVGVHSSFSSATDSVIRRFDYDHMGRVIREWHRLNNQSEILLVHNDYNELGQLVDKKLHSTVAAATDARQSLDYRYNIRAWLTKINESDIDVGTADPSNSGEQRDYFGMELGYNADIGIANSPLYNGNISAIKWSKNLGVGAVKQDAYLYGYDALNRITAATFQEKGTTWGVATNSGFSESNYSYDLNGNILGLKRYDQRGTAAPMDSLKYNYGTTISNQLLGVSDGGDKYSGFIDGTTGMDYTYDANGNMITDQNKGITTAITYNYLNLPQLVVRGGAGGNSVQYVYDASGRKLSQGVTFSGAQKQTDYSGEYQYENSVLQFIGHEEGRIMRAKTTTIFTDDASATSNFTAFNATLSAITQNAATYIKVVATGTVSFTGAFPIGGTIPVVAGERYKVRARGYRDQGTAASSSPAYLHIKINGTTDQGWPGALLPASMSTAPTETWIEQIVTIPTGVATMQVGVAWNTVLSGEAIYVNDFEITKLETLTPEYQYNLKDHLGNVRVTFTTQTVRKQFTAGFETANQSAEAANFSNYPSGSHVNTVAINANTGTNSLYLNGGYSGGQVGVTKSFSVMPGDTVSIKAYAKYNTPTSNPTDLTAFAVTLLAAFNLTPPVGGEIGTARTALNTYGAAEPVFVDGNSSDQSDPKIFVTILIFDRNYNFLDVAFQRSSSSGSLLSASYTIKQPGYAYMYISNEQTVQTDVYFDDITMTLSQSAVIQQDDYYPFGLKFSSYSRENSVPNTTKLFQGQEHIDDLGLNWDAFKWRNYQPDIGRFFNIDPLAEKYVYNSTYAFAENKVITLRELEGLEGVHYMDGNDHVVEKNVMVLLRQQKAIPQGADAKTVKKIERQNARIGRENASKLAGVASELNTFFNGSNGKGTQNSKGENVVFKFNVTGANDFSKDEKKQTSTENRNTMYRAFGVAGGLLGSSSLAPSRTLIAPAAVLTTEGASGGQGNTLGASVMRVNSNAAEGATSHEVLHTLGLPDNGYDKGGLLNSPPGSISTSEVDDALKYSYKKE